MYSHLLSAYDNMSPEGKKGAEAAAHRLRLTVSGSDACPLPVMQRWQALSGEQDMCKQLHMWNCLHNGRLPLVAQTRELLGQPGVLRHRECPACYIPHSSLWHMKYRHEVH
jgi:hypothetical protein